MLVGLELYAAVKVTPPTINSFEITNPLGVAPKYVHIECQHSAEPYTEFGFIREAWVFDYGGYFDTNGSSYGDNTNYFELVSEAPTSGTQTCYLGANQIVFRKGGGTVSGKWSTNTEYTVHIYADTLPKITIANAFTNANTGKTEVDSLMSTAGLAEDGKIIVLKSANTIQDNQLIFKDWINTTSGYLVRLRTGSLNRNDWDSSSVDCKAAVGDEYYVVDLAASYSLDSKAVPSNITKASDLKSFIDANLPGTGSYFVWVTKDPSTLVRYDFVCGVFGDKVIAFRADSNKRTEGLVAFTAVYDAKLYSGDTINYLKLPNF